MKRSRPPRRSKASAETDQLSRLASGLASSASRAEDVYWETHLEALIDHLLKAGEDETLDAALDYLYETDLHAYDELAESIEARAESLRLESDGILLVAIPLLVWSRAAIPAGPIAAGVLADLRAQLHGHILAQDARLALADFLFSPDQMPRGYAKTFKLTTRFSEAARNGRDLHLEAKRLPKSADFLADARYIIAGVATVHGGPLFRWQEENQTRDAALEQWKAQGTPCVAALLAGCAYELLLPDAYYAAGRKAEREARPFSVRAAITLLESGLSAKPENIGVVIAPFYEERLEEYRLAFVVEGNVVYGVVWPLLGAEDDNSVCVAEIEALLRERGVIHTLVLDERLPLEYCEDCGAPLFANAEGEPVHAEWPEDNSSSSHLH
ncbi:MAG: DUF2863 family protein [Burkholderiales bacterium]|nr:DUF2863 family protein [Burkholderiales bacterium]